MGILLYYALAVGCNLLLSLSDLASAQLNKSNKVWYDLVWLLNNASTRSDTSITYIASYMCFHAHIDASYLSTPNARSRASGNVFFGDKPTQRNPPAYTALNGPIHVILKIIKDVMGSASEADTSMHGSWYQSVYVQKKWAIHKSQLQCRLTIPRQ